MRVHTEKWWGTVAKGVSVNSPATALLIEQEWIDNTQPNSNGWVGVVPQITQLPIPTLICDKIHE